MSHYNNICLVHSPLDLNAAHVPDTGSLAPLGLICLATHIQDKISNISIRIIDGDLLGVEEVKKELTKKKYDLVGIGVQACESYRTALKIAKTAKDNGASVVMGGEQATIRAEQILRNQQYIDFVIRGQGESGLLRLIEGVDRKGIPNLVYRVGKNIINNPSTRLSLRTLPIPDRSFVDQKVYSTKFQQTLESKLTGFKSFATVRTQDGCMKAIKEGACTFCVRDDLLVARFRSPEQFWEEMLYLEKEQHIDYVWDISPSFSSVPITYLVTLANTKPSSAEIRFRIYARADDLAERKKVEILKRIGIESVLVGFDSGNQHCLNASHKGTTLEQHRVAARNLREYGISTYSGFVLGHLAETYQSMLDTLNHAKELRVILGDKLFRTVTCSKMQLYPGSGEWNTFLSTNSELMARYENSDVIDIQKLSKIYFRDYLRIDSEEADRIAEEIRSLAPIKSGKDRPMIVH